MSPHRALSGAVCMQRRWIPGLSGVSGTSCSEGEGRTTAPASPYVTWVKGTGIFVVPIDSVGSHSTRARTRQSAFGSHLVYHCAEPLEAAVLSAAVIPLEFICLFLDISNHYTVNTKAFHNSGKAKNEIEGKMMILRAVSELLRGDSYCHFP